MAVLASLLVHLGVDADDLNDELDRIDRGMRQAGSNAAALGKTLGAAFAVGPVAAPIIAAGAGIASAFVAAGAGAVAFKAAVAPQLNEVTEASDLYTAALEAQAEGGEKAQAAMQAYKDAMAEMAPATRDTATAFIGLKEDFSAWSDSLAGTTMPIFTNGIETLRDLLPTLTPFVEDAASALGDFGKQISQDVKSEGFMSFVDSLRSTAKTVLPKLLRSARNVAIGFGGILEAFMPMSDSMVGGIETITEKFAAFGQGISDSPVFAKFQELSGAGGGALANLGAALVEVLVSMEPLLGATTQLAIVFAQIVSAIPTDALVFLGQALVALKLATIAYTVVTRTIAIVTGLWTAAQGALNIIMMMNPIGLIVAAVVALIAIIVMISTKTDFFKNLWEAAWNGIKKAFDVAVEFVKKGFNFMKNLFMNFTGPGLIIKHFDKIKSTISKAFDFVKDKVRQGFNFMKNVFLNFTGPGLVIRHFGKIRDTIANIMGRVKELVSNGISRVKTIIQGLKSMPGKVKDWFSGLGSKIGDVLVDGFKGGINAIIRGWNGLEFSVPGINMPGPIPDIGGFSIGTPNVPMLAKGGVATGPTFAMIGEGREDEAVLPLSKLDAMLANASAPKMTNNIARVDSQVNVVIDVRGGDSMLKEWLRKSSRVDNILAA